VISVFNRFLGTEYTEKESSRLATRIAITKDRRAAPRDGEPTLHVRPWLHNTTDAVPQALILQT
jgi:hypothetical protein